MIELPRPWDQYLEHQTKLDQSHQVCNASWELEGVLDRIVLSNQQNKTTDQDIKRAAKNRSRRERYQAQLRRLYLSHDDGHAEIELRIQAREELRIIRSQVTDEEWDILCELSDGSRYNELAPKGTRSATVRIRVMRIRRRIDPVLLAA